MNISFKATVQPEMLLSAEPSELSHQSLAFSFKFPYQLFKMFKSVWSVQHYCIKEKHGQYLQL